MGKQPLPGSLPGSSVHGIFQARVLEWVAIAFSTWEHLAESKSPKGQKQWQPFLCMPCWETQPAESSSLGLSRGTGELETGTSQRCVYSAKREGKRRGGELKT